MSQRFLSRCLLILHFVYSNALSNLSMRMGVIKNFRPTFGVPYLYRSASLDPMGSLDNLQHPVERLVAQEIGLIIDLRSESERDQSLLNAWTDKYGINVQTYSGFIDGWNTRTLLQLEPLVPAALFEYIEQAWFTSTDKILALFYKIFDAKQLHCLLINKLNERGLAGLNEAILESGKDALRTGLESLTIYRERYQGTPAIVHCVQGKDRTGVFCMLCQSILNIDDHGIICDYHASQQFWLANESAANKLVEPRTGKIDKRFFSGAPKKAMAETLGYLRSNYGSVTVYLDHIGFDNSWRQRFVATHNRDMTTSRL